jgi:hypothetical protein
MRALLPCLMLLLVACGEAEKPAGPKYPWKAAAPAPKGETLRFPPNDQVSVSVVEDQILGHDFLPGGNLGVYKKGTKEYKLFLVKMADYVAPANALLEYKNRMPDAKLVATFGGYAGTDRGQPAFVFTKGLYLLGIVGLTPEEADPVARYFAGRVN